MILLLGDLHGGFGHVERVVAERPEATNLLGDIQVPLPLGKALGKVLDKTESPPIHSLQRDMRVGGSRSRINQDADKLKENNK